ncbi:CHY zinc finger protein [Aeribacillus alveayuensis]|uniref:CHY-type Zn-finger protein n=1 Tax=Aeribacillus alveayuensis TaxID=279215 RepID=A0ABT9VR61_9BACI|nr:putative CHY-type Zn-finger protein [Bacillus alveayuensis]
MIIHGIEVKGKLIDEKTRCKHYHKDVDVIAIKFYCCKTYYPCYECHEEEGCGNHQVWPNELFDEKAILCGNCGTELTIEEYLNCHYQCPECHVPFNPGCGRHRHYYFGV